MELPRRGFFASLLAPLIARCAPKLLPVTTTAPPQLSAIGTKAQIAAFRGRSFFAERITDTVGRVWELQEAYTDTGWRPKPEWFTWFDGFMTTGPMKSSIGDTVNIPQTALVDGSGGATIIIGNLSYRRVA